MPNWCSNRMYFSGEPAQIAEIKRLASGAVTPFYRRATNEGIQLFLAGSAGLLQTTEDVQFSGQKVVYGCMQGTGVIFRDAVTVSGCLLLRPLRLPAAWRHPVVRPDSDGQLLAHPPVSAEPAGAVSGCRYGPMRENPACSDRSGRAAPVTP
ncbi:hypothetical protein P0G49_004122 [Escherichia coli]|nr:hypothetical protein [Escherichia coli]